MTTITGTIKDVTGRPDSSPWIFYSPTFQQGPSGQVITTQKREVRPQAGILTVELDPGVCIIQHGDSKWPVTIPEADADLWEIIEAGVAHPPNTSQELLDAAVGQYVETHREQFRTRAIPVEGDPTMAQWVDEYDNPVGDPVPWSEVVSEAVAQAAVESEAPAAVDADLASRSIGFVDEGSGTGHFTVGGVPVSGTLVPPAATWSGIAGRPMTVITASGSDQAAEINAALAATFVGDRKTVKLVGDFLHSTTLVIPSDTTLDLTDATLTCTSATGTIQIKNAACTPTDTGTGTIALGSTTLTTDATATVGQVVTVQGADATGTTWLTGTVVSVGVGTLELSVAAKSAVADAAVKVFSRERNINIIGGKVDRGATPDGGGPTSMNIMLRWVDGFVVDTSVHSTTGKYGLNPAGCTNGWVRLRNCEHNSAACQIIGPARDIHIEEITGNFHDDVFAITASDWPQYGDTSGDVYNVTIGNIHATTTTSLMHIIAGDGNVIDNVKVLGTLSGGGAAIRPVMIGDGSSMYPSVSGGEYGTIDCGTIYADSDYSILHIPSPTKAAMIKAHIRIDRTTRPPNVVSIGPGNMGGAEIGVIDVTIDADATEHTAKMVYVLGNAPDTTVRQLIVRGRCLINALGGSFFNGVYGSFDKIVFRDLDIIYPSAVSGNFVVAVNATVTALNSVLFDGGRVSNASNLLYMVSGNVVPSVRLGLNNVAIDNCARIVDCRTGTVITNLSGAYLDTVTSGAFHAVQSSGGGLELHGSFTSNGALTLLSRSGAPPIRIRSLGIRADASLVSRNAGDLMYNTNAALSCGVGPIVCDGTNWKHLFTGATY